MKHHKTNTKQNLAIIACVLSPHIAFCVVFLLFLKFPDTVFLQVRSPFPLGVYQSLFWCLSLCLVHNKCQSSEFFKATAAIVVDEMFWGNIRSHILKQGCGLQFSYLKTLKTKTYCYCKIFYQSTQKVLLAWEHVSCDYFPKLTFSFTYPSSVWLF